MHFLLVFLFAWQRRKRRKTRQTSCLSSSHSGGARKTKSRVRSCVCPESLTLCSLFHNQNTRGAKPRHPPNTMPYKSEPTHRERAGADLLLSLTKKSIVTPATTNSTTNTMYSKALHSPIKTSSFSNDWSPSSVSNILQNPLETSPDRHRHHDSTGEEDEHLPPPQPPMEAHKEYNDAAALGVDHKQRIISPSSSNERPDDDESIKTTQIQHHQQPYPSWTGPPPPHYPFAYPQPPPYGAPPFGGWPCLYPPPHGMPPPPPQLYPDAVAEDGLATNVNRCVPLKPPIPTRYWGYVSCCCGGMNSIRLLLCPLCTLVAHNPFSF